jgi:integrase
MSDRLYRRRKNGKLSRIWWCWYYDKAKLRVRTSTRCTNKDAARGVLERLERAAHDPRHHAANTTTVKAALEQALKAIAARGRAEGTLDMYTTKARHLARLLGPDTPLADVDAGAVDGFIETRLEEGASRSTLGKELTTLRQTLKIAKRRGQFPFDLAEIMPVQWSIDYQPSKRCLPNGLALQVLVDELLPDRGAHLCFFVATGARDSEAAAARAKDIDLERGVVHIRGKKTVASDDDVAIVAWMKPLLEHVLRVRGDVKGPLFRPWTNVRGDLLDACRRGAARLHELAGEHRTFGREIDAQRAERAAAALEEGLSPNALRRTHSTWLRAAGIDLGHIARQLRHKSLKMVFEVYGRMDASTTGAVMEAALAGTGGWCDTGVPKRRPSRGSSGRDGLKIPRKPVPRDGIEPPTRGFSILPGVRAYDGRSPGISASVGRARGGRGDAGVTTGGATVVPLRARRAC